MPLGVVTSALSPFDFPISALAIGELMERGYEDAYRTFIEPVVAVSGEELRSSREGS